MQTKKMSKKKIWMLSIMSVLMSAVLALSGVGIYLKLSHKEKAPAVVNPLDFSVDAWDGKTVDGLNFTNNFAGRGYLTKTINSAASFMHFVNEVNNGFSFKNYVVYLNSSIDLQGHKIDSIGNAENPFEGKFDGGHYTIFNANVNGNGLFGATNNAEIKNIGLYNANTNLIDKAINTNIENTFVRLGNGNIANEFISTSGPHSIKNSFVDSNASGLINKLDTNSTSEAEVSIINCYYVNGNKLINNEVGQIFTTQEKAIKATNKSDFADWSYSTEFNMEKDWCDYDYLENSQKLEFRFPVQAGFVKVYLTGSCYESVVYANGTAIDVTNMAQAFTEADKEDEAQVNLLVEKIFMEAQAEVSNADIKINAATDTTIVRGENNEESMFVTKGDAKLTLGGESDSLRSLRSVGMTSGQSSLSYRASETSRAYLTNASDISTITIDGNREHVENNNLESGALVVAYGGDVEIGSNVTFKNNVNNSDVSYGGAVLLYNTNEMADIKADFYNCHSENGGGAVAVVGTTIESLGSCYNCSSNGNGGALYLTMELPSEETQAMRRIYGEGLNVQPTDDMLDPNNTNEVADGTVLDERYNDFVFESCSGEYGGAIYCEGDLTISGNPTFKLNSVVDNGGAIACAGLTISGAPVFIDNMGNMYGGAIWSYGDCIISGNPTFKSNSVADNGGAIACAGLTISGAPVFIESWAEMRGGAIWCDSDCIISGNPTFTSNYANAGGGALAILKITISGNPIFTENLSSGDGGVILGYDRINGGEITISGSPRFESNKAEYGSGGAICVTTVNFENGSNVDFEGNYAGAGYMDDACRGGAIYATTVNFESGSNVEFSSNYAQCNHVGGVTSGGGAIYATIVDIKTGSTVDFNGNHTTTAQDSYGGAINADTIKIAGTAKFIDNYTAMADSGGHGYAIYAKDLEITGDVTINSIRRSGSDWDDSWENSISYHYIAEIEFTNSMKLGADLNVLTTSKYLPTIKIPSTKTITVTATLKKPHVVYKDGAAVGSEICSWDTTKLAFNSNNTSSTAPFYVMNAPYESNVDGNGDLQYVVGYNISTGKGTIGSAWSYEMTLLDVAAYGKVGEPISIRYWDDCAGGYDLAFHSWDEDFGATNLFGGSETDWRIESGALYMNVCSYSVTPVKAGKARAIFYTGDAEGRYEYIEFYIADENGNIPEGGDSGETENNYLTLLESSTSSPWFGCVFNSTVNGRIVVESSDSNIVSTSNQVITISAGTSYCISSNSNLSYCDSEGNDIPSANFIDVDFITKGPCKLTIKLYPATGELTDDNLLDSAVYTVDATNNYPIYLSEEEITVDVNGSIDVILYDRQGDGLDWSGTIKSLNPSVVSVKSSYVAGGHEMLGGPQTVLAPQLSADSGGTAVLEIKVEVTGPDQYIYLYLTVHVVEPLGTLSATETTVALGEDVDVDLNIKDGEFVFVLFESDNPNVVDVGPLDSAGSPAECLNGECHITVPGTGTHNLSDYLIVRGLGTATIKVLIHTGGSEYPDGWCEQHCQELVLIINVVKPKASASVKQAEAKLGNTVDVEITTGTEYSQTYIRFESSDETVVKPKTTYGYSHQIGGYDKWHAMVAAGGTINAKDYLEVLGKGTAKISVIAVEPEAAGAAGAGIMAGTMSTESYVTVSTFTVTVSPYIITFISNNDAHGWIVNLELSSITQIEASLNDEIIIEYNNNSSYLKIGQNQPVLAACVNGGSEHVYSFVGWTGIPADGKVTHDLMIMANFEKKLEIYTLNFSVDSTDNYGTLSTSQVQYVYAGLKIEFKDNVVDIEDSGTVIATPTASTAEYAYKFDRWESSIDVDYVTGDVDIIAHFTRETAYHTVTIVANPSGYGSVTGYTPGGQELNANAVSLAYGSNIAIGSDYIRLGTGDFYEFDSAPKAADAQYTYTFTGWTLADGSEIPSTVTGPMTIYANFERTVNQYTVTIEVDPEGWGTVDVTTLTVDYGTILYFDFGDDQGILIGQDVDLESYATAKAADAQYTYFFDGWFINNERIDYGEREEVTDDIIIVAKFDRVVNTYTVVWKNYDGTVLETDTVEYGTTPTYDGDEPTKPATAEESFTFTGWSPAVTSVTGDIEYTAQFSSETNAFTVTIVRNNDDYGTVSAYSIPNVVYGTTITVNANKTLTIGTTTLTATPTADTDQYDYEFEGWVIPGNATQVTGPMTITAEFSRTVKTYTITVSLDENSKDFGTLNSTETITAEYGSTIYAIDNILTIAGQHRAVITNDNTAQYTYTFKQWTYYNKEDVVTTSDTVTGDMTITATIEQTENVYAVNIMIDSVDHGYLNGIADHDEPFTVPYGTKVVIESNVLKFIDPEDGDVIRTTTATPANGYKFVKWQGVVGLVNGDITITAIFDTIKLTANQDWLSYGAYGYFIIPSQTGRLVVTSSNENVVKVNNATQNVSANGMFEFSNSDGGVLTYINAGTAELTFKLYPATGEMNDATLIEEITLTYDITNNPFELSTYNATLVEGSTTTIDVVGWFGSGYILSATSASGNVTISMPDPEGLGEGWNARYITLTANSQTSSSFEDVITVAMAEWDLGVTYYRTIKVTVQPA